ncbi:MAG TPA: hypothetical protein VNQ52_12680 [Microbacteriaceae bacterium]|nr:hypothetical protein [Microbacteriaceae bacterium]
MYGALWRLLPGPAWVRALILVLLVAAILTACALWIFPWVEHTFFMEDSTVVDSAGGSASS